MVPAHRRGEDEPGVTEIIVKVARTLALALLLLQQVAHAQTATVIVVETTKGAFVFETYPNEAPKTIAHVVQLVRQGFYDGQGFHRALAGFVVQWGDPRSRDMGKEADWGRGDAASSGTP